MPVAYADLVATSSTSRRPGAKPKLNWLGAYLAPRASYWRRAQRRYRRLHWGPDAA